MASTQVEVKKSAAPAPAGNGSDVWQSLRHEMENLFDRAATAFEMPAFRGFGNIEKLWPKSFGSIVSLAVDVSEDDKTYKVTAELPGMDEKDVEVTMGDDYIAVKGEKRQEKEEKGKNQYLCERSYGSFQRTFSLPSDVKRDQIDAKFSKGVLTITMPKATQSQTHKKIEVKAA